jgi:acetolactate decarboxylase
VTVWFEPTLEFELNEPLDNDEFLAKLDERLPAAANSCALRIDGDFDLVHARSVPRQEPPYRPLGEVVADQHVFDFQKASGTLVGFRFQRPPCRAAAGHRPFRFRPRRVDPRGAPAG